jgi:pimeloyl-ACP methyl ester carboxylesterase
MHPTTTSRHSVNSTLKTPAQTATTYLTRPRGASATTSTAPVRLSFSSPAWATCAPRIASSRQHCAKPATGSPARIYAAMATATAQVTSYGDVETAADILALIQELGGPAVVAGNSMGAGAAALAAALAPELVSGLVLIGPFVRNGEIGALQRRLLRIAMARPWAATAWKAYMPKLPAGQRPVDFAEYRDRVVASLRRPGYAKAFSLTTRTNHGPAQARLAEVATPTLVLMGELDPDFPDPRAEADWIAEILHGDVVMVPDAGHYPQSQRPDLAAAAVIRCLTTVNGRG